MSRATFNCRTQLRLQISDDSLEFSDLHFALQLDALTCKVQRQLTDS
jgi:hypothetical protein